MKFPHRCARTLLFALLAAGLSPALYAQDVPLRGTTIQNPADLGHAQGFVSRNESVEQVMAAVASSMGRSPIVSAKARKKRVTGNFDLAEPARLLDRLSSELGLIWYSDGELLYVYDATEAESAVGHFRHASVPVLVEFLNKTRLSDRRYSVRGGNNGAFYVSGPPVYVNLVLKAARYLDALYEGSDKQATHVEVIKLRNSFVSGRRFTVRDETQNLPGVADVLQAILGDVGPEGVRIVRSPQDQSPALDGEAAPVDAPAPALPDTWPSSASTGADTPAVIVAYTETNSLLVRGTRNQIRQIKDLVAEIDVARSQVELSLWIIDIRKSELDQLGVRWQGAVGVGGHLGIGLNQEPGSVSTLNGSRFLATVHAMSEAGDAVVTSRPALLTQENTEARFDANQSFYASLVGERTSSLEKVTYGTSIHVLPRVSPDRQVEMQLQIEDGNASGDEQVDGLPVVSRTNISTVARVPHGMSLLVGGYSRSASEMRKYGIPGLRKIPFIGGAFRGRNKREDSVVRLYLIQPRVLGAQDNLSTAQMVSEHGPQVGFDLPQAAREVRNRLELEHGERQ